MKIFDLADCDENQKRNLLVRPGGDFDDLFPLVKSVLSDVRSGGDMAIKRSIARFENLNLSNFVVRQEEWDRAVDEIEGTSLDQSIRLAANNIRSFHDAQRPLPSEVVTTAGVRCWQVHTPIESVGLYVPGGRAPLISTVLMLGVPAQAAGCGQRIMCTPARADGTIEPSVLFAAYVAGIHQIFKIGGIQAIAAMAIGSESVPKTDKIFGPGNRYVTAAKALVSLPPYLTGIDVLAGPSELLVIADESAPPEWIAADLISQAEHGPDSLVVLVSENMETLQRISSEVKKRCELLRNHPPLFEALMASLSHSFCVKTRDVQEAMGFSNAFAPEHLMLAVRDGMDLVREVRHAGSVFLGPMTSVVLGDYASGTNHTLPTAGFARFSGGVTLNSFLKPVSFQTVSSEGFTSISRAVCELATAEGLVGHVMAVQAREFVNEQH